MEMFAAKEVKQSLGRVMNVALRTPVTITKHGKPTLVMTSQEDYDALLDCQRRLLEREVKLGFEALDGKDISLKTTDELWHQALESLKA